MIDPSGACPNGTVPRTTEMPQVWLVDNPDAPFAERPPAAAESRLIASDGGGRSAEARAELIGWNALVAGIASFLHLNSFQIRVRF